MEDEHCQRTIHAEVNAVIRASRGESLEDSTIYIWSSRGDEKPCRECMKVLKAARVRRAVGAVEVLVTPYLSGTFMFDDSNTLEVP